MTEAQMTMDRQGISARFHVDWPGFSLDLDEHLPARGVTALFGHSGSGKTTLLRCIAGLEHAAQGRLSFNGEVWQDEGIWVPTHRRPIGYVFQEASPKGADGSDAGVDSSLFPIVAPLRPDL